MTISRTTFDPDKHYKRIRFHEDRDLLDSELNELQEIAIQERIRLFDGIYAPGCILDGLTATANGYTLTLSAGLVYLDGHAVSVPDARVTVSGEGEHTIWVDIFYRDIGVSDDPSLVNPLTGEPTAEREKWVASLQTRDTSIDPLPEGASGRSVIPIFSYNATTGIITTIQPRPSSPDDGSRLDNCTTLLQLVDETVSALEMTVTAHIGAGDTAHPDASSSNSGFMTAADKVKMDGLAALPAGVIMPYAGSAVPDGWRECNGDEISRDTFAFLFAAIGTIYGVGNGTTTFNLPDLRGEFLRGWDHGRGIDEDRDLGSAQIDSLASHTHPITGDTSGGDNPWGGIERKISTDDNPVNDGTESGIMAHLFVGPNGTDVETRPRNIAMMYLIKI